MSSVQDQVALAHRLITSKGGPVDVVYVIDSPPPNPDEPWNLGPVTTRIESTRGVLLTAKHIKYGLAVDQQKDDDDVHKEERRLLLSAASLTEAPTVKCEIRIGEERWKIVSVTPLKPAGVDIIYTLQVRR